MARPEAPPVPLELAGFVDQSLDGLQAAWGDARQVLGRALGPVVLTLEVDGETVGLAAPDGVLVRVEHGEPTVRVVAARAALRAVVSSEVTVVEALVSGEIEVQGLARDLDRVHEVLLRYLERLVRARESVRHASGWIGLG